MDRQDGEWVAAMIDGGTNSTSFRCLVVVQDLFARMASDERAKGGRNNDLEKDWSEEEGMEG